MYYSRCINSQKDLVCLVGKERRGQLHQAPGKTLNHLLPTQLFSYAHGFFSQSLAWLQQERGCLVPRSHSSRALLRAVTAWLHAAPPSSQRPCFSPTTLAFSRQTTAQDHPPPNNGLTRLRWPHLPMTAWHPDRVRRITLALRGAAGTHPLHLPDNLAPQACTAVEPVPICPARPCP